MSSNNIGDECLKECGEWIQGNNTLQVLCLNDNCISDKGINILVPYLSGNTTLQNLNLAKNKMITDLSINHLNESLENTSIEELSLVETSGSSPKILFLNLIRNKFKNESKILDMSQWLSLEELEKVYIFMQKYGITHIREIKYVDLCFYMRVFIFYNLIFLFTLVLKRICSCPLFYQGLWSP